MRNYEEAIAAGQFRRAFSDAASRDAWVFRWCDQCINDLNGDCPLLNAALYAHVVPAEWTPVGDWLYECDEFQPREESS